VVEVLGSGLVYGGALVSVLGMAGATQPGFGTPAALAVTALGAAAIVIGLAIPAQSAVAPSPRMRLDAWLPAWQFREVHSILVHASPGRVFRAVKDVTAGEVRLFRTLTWIRNPRPPWAETPESILAVPARRPILDAALHSGFVLLEEDGEHEMVVGTLIGRGGAHVADAAAFAAAPGPGFAKAGMNFLLESEAGGWVRLTTETRVQASAGEGRRRFAAYWRAIYPGSALIRRMWLRAIKARAEKGNSA
jgi:hypothetical protein